MGEHTRNLSRYHFTPSVIKKGANSFTRSELMMRGLKYVMTPKLALGFCVIVIVMLWLLYRILL